MKKLSLEKMENLKGGQADGTACLLAEMNATNALSSATDYPIDSAPYAFFMGNFFATMAWIGGNCYF